MDRCYKKNNLNINLTLFSRKIYARDDNAEET